MRHTFLTLAALPLLASCAGGDPGNPACGPLNSAYDAARERLEALQGFPVTDTFPDYEADNGLGITLLAMALDSDTDTASDTFAFVEDLSGMQDRFTAMQEAQATLSEASVARNAAGCS